MRRKRLIRPTKTQQHQQIVQFVGQIRRASIASGTIPKTWRLSGLARHNLDNLPIRLLHRMAC
ncbi:hypothetical protein QZK98_12970 [Escherichia coli]|nr:hypothetical protein [Escherichia coli]